MSLFWRAVTINGAVLLAAALVLVVSPATVSASVAAAEVAVLGAGRVVAIPEAPALSPSACGIAWSAPAGRSATGSSNRNGEPPQ